MDLVSLTGGYIGANGGLGKPSLPLMKAMERGFEALFRLRDEAATEVVLVRHAEADVGQADTNEDPPLSRRGIFQASLLSQRLEQFWVEAIYCSPEQRAIQTAAVLARGRQAAVRVQGLREIGAKAEAPASESVGRLSAMVASRFLADPRWDALPRLEPGHEFRRRVIESVDRIIARHPARRVLIATHASVINAYLGKVLGVQRDMFFFPEHTSVSVIRSLAGVTSLQIINDFSHLSASDCAE